MEKAPFTSTQEMYNYAANQLIVQKLSQEQVKNNLMKRGVTDADAEIVVQNMMVQIEKDKKAESAVNHVESTVRNVPLSVEKTEPSFVSTQEMYNYAANQLIVQKLDKQTVKINLMKHGVSNEDADIVIKNMMVEIEKNKTVKVKSKKTEARGTMLAGLVIAGIGAALYGKNLIIAGESFPISYGILVVGAILFFKGLIRMF